MHRHAPAVGSGSTTMTSADFSLRRWLPTSSCPTSPFQARGEISPSKDNTFPRTTAGSTYVPISGRWSFAVTGPLAPRTHASYPVLVHRPTVSLHASFTPSSRPDALRFAMIAATCSQKDFHLLRIAHVGRTKAPYGLAIRPSLRGSPPFDSRGGCPKGRAAHRPSGDDGAGWVMSEMLCCYEAPAAMCAR